MTREGRATFKLIEDPAIYEDICENTPDLIQCIDKKGKFVYVNKKWMKTLGYSAVEIAKLKLDDILHPDQRRKCNQLFKRVCRGETIENIETVFLNNKGEAVIVHGNVKPRMKDGRFLTTMGIFSDITVRKMDEEALMKSEKLYRNIVELSPDGIATCDTKGIITSCNSAFLKQMGFARDEIVGKHFTKLPTLHARDIPKFFKILGSLLTGKTPKPFEIKWLHKDGSERIGEVIVSIVKDKNKITGIQTIARDMTEHRRMEDLLGERMKELQVFYGLSEINDREGISLEELYRELANILPISWEYAEIACARIVIGNKEFRTKKFTESKWMQSAPVKASKTVVGRIDVGYLEERPKQDEGPFLKEERRLIDAVAERLGHIIERKRAEEALQESEQRFKAIFDHSNDGILLADMEKKRFFIGNKTICQMLGYSPDEIKDLGVMDIHPPEDLPHVVDQFEKQARKEIDIAKDLPVVRKDGSIFYADVSAFPITLAGKPYLVGAFRDTSERKRMEAVLKESEERYRELVEKAGIAILVDDIEGNFKYYNNKFAELFGYSYAEMAGMSYPQIVHPDDLSRVTKCHQARMQHKDTPTTYEFTGIRKGSVPIPLEVSVKPLTKGERIIGTRSYFWDVSSRKRIEEELRLQSLHDSLTGLYNRRGFLALARHQQTVADRTGKGFFIVYADLDQMKSINDDHGHAIGDEALKAIAEVLTGSFRKSDVIGRLGGDEFAVCAIEALPDSAQVMMNRIKNNLDGYNKLHRLKVSLSLSIGTAYYDPKQPCLIEDLLERADQMMYRQKTHKDGTGLQLEAAPLVFDLQQHKTEFNVKSVQTRVLVVPATSESMISLQSALAVDPGLPIELVIAQDLEHGFNLIDNQVINIVLLETKIQTDAGIDVLRQVQKRCPELPVIVLVDTDDEVLSAQAVREGAQDCLNKTRLDTGLLIRSIRYAIERSRTVLELKNSFSKFLMVFEDTVNTMASIVEVRDPCTAGHQKRVSQLAQTIAQEMNLSDEQRRGIRMAALIHDVGKTKVPEKILNKTGTLNKHEMDLIKTHPSAGYEILKAIKFPWLVTEIVHQHHERMDGSGYPEGIAGNAILLESKILAVADVVEAMCADRSYRTAPGLEKALDEITSKKNTLYDMQVVDACVNVFKEKKFKFN